MSAPSDTAAAVRRHHRDLRPLATGNDLTKLQGHRASHTSVSSSRSTTPLPSPSLVAARAYYHEHVVPIGQENDGLQRRRSLIDLQRIPRRNSASASAGGLTTQFAGFMLSGVHHNTKPLPEAADQGLESTKKEEGNIVSNSPPQDGHIRLTVGSTQPPSSGSDDPAVRFLRRVPFQYTHEHLREWGHAYLGNTFTADAFVNAVSLRRPSLAMVKEESAQNKSESLGMTTIRARIIPKAKERRPLLIQRRFDIEEVRSGIPALQKLSTSEDSRSSRAKRSCRTRRSSTQPISVRNQRRGSAERYRGAQLELLGTRGVPIREFFYNCLPAHH